MSAALAAGIVSGTLHIVAYVLEAYVVLLVLRAILSWFPVRHGSPFAAVLRVLDALTEPVLAPLRRAIPPVRAGMMAIDVSIIVVVLGLEIVATILLRI